MKIKRIEFAFLLLLAVFLQSCEYNPLDVYERPVTKDVTPPQIQTLILDINYDTIFLYPEPCVPNPIRTLFHPSIPRRRRLPRRRGRPDRTSRVRHSIRVV